MVESQPSMSIDYIEDEQKSVQDRMNNILNEIRQKDEFINCRLQIDAYNDHNNMIKNVIQERRKALDIRYDQFNIKINYIQISIIVLSTFSGFIQATSKFTSIPENYILFMGVLISTYISLLLSIAKYKKYDERKERIHNLREQFSDFLIKLQTRNDLLDTWKADNLWAGRKIDEKYKLWNDLSNKLDSDYDSIIERKQQLFCEYEKIMDSTNQTIYNLILKQRELKTMKKMIKLKNITNKLSWQDNKTKMEQKEIEMNVNYM